MVGEQELFELVDPKVRDHIISKFKHYQIDDLLACFSELLKFLYLTSKYPNLSRNFIPVTQEVDELWHALILQTLSYETMCSRFPGKRMLHHESMNFIDYKSGIPKGDLVNEVLRWIVLYVRNFGELREDRLQYWFFINLVKKTLNISLSELNHIAKNDTYFLIEEPKHNSSGQELEYSTAERTFG